MSENLFTVLGLAPGPADDARIVAAYERRLAECRRRIRDENQRAAREEGLIYAYAVLRDPARREAYLRKHQPAVRLVSVGDTPAAQSPPTASARAIKSPPTASARAIKSPPTASAGCVRSPKRSVSPGTPPTQSVGFRTGAPASEEAGAVPVSEPHGKNKPDAIRRLCQSIDAAMIGGRIDGPHRRAIHSRAHLLGVTPFEAELLMASAIERHRRRTAGETADDSEARPNHLARIIATCLTIILLALFLYSRL